MKKLIIKCSIFLAMVVIAVCAIRFVQCHLIFFAQVKTVNLQNHHCDSGEAKTVELTKSEIRKILTYYNLSSYAGHVDAEGFDYEYRIDIHLYDGKHIAIIEAGRFGLEAETPSGQYWVKSDQLDEFARELLDKYGLLNS